MVSLELRTSAGTGDIRQRNGATIIDGRAAGKHQRSVVDRGGAGIAVVATQLHQARAGLVSPSPRCFV